MKKSTFLLLVISASVTARSQNVITPAAQQIRDKLDTVIRLERTGSETKK